MGEKFAANPVTGTGSTAVPIATSPGRAGFGPQFSLSYDSGSGNGPFGFGWSLSLPAITRKTDKGLPQYIDAEESDAFILSGAEDLVPVLVQDADGEWHRQSVPPRAAGPNTYEVQRFRPRIEGLFARIERWTNASDSADVHWRSISKDNILTLYGRDENSRICDPADPRHIFSWLICETRDDKGNAILYRYQEEDGRDVDLAQAHEANRGDENDTRRRVNRYLKQVYYGNRNTLLVGERRPVFLTQAQLDAAEWMFEVVFDYDEGHVFDETTDAKQRTFVQTSSVATHRWKRRNDPFSSYRAGFEVRTSRLCQRVLMLHHFPGERGVGMNCLVRSTDFTYSYEAYEEKPADAGNPIYSFLLSVTQTGYKQAGAAGYLKRSLPPLELEYTLPMVQDTVHEVGAESLENLPVGLDGAANQWTDLHGEGVPGILTEQAGAWFYKRNLSPINLKPGNGKGYVEAKFAPVELVASRPNLALGDGQVQFMDLAGDGEPDLVVLDGPLAGLAEHDGEEGWQSFHPFTARLNREMRDPNLRFADLDGDGHADVLVSEDDAFVWHPSLGEGGFGPERHVAKALDEEKGPRLVFADPTRREAIYLADMSGDGLADLVRIRNGEVCYWPNLGYGRFGAKVAMDRAPLFDHADQFDHNRIRLADIDGSGTTDILYLHRNGVRLYFNLSGNGWGDARRLDVFPRVDNLVDIQATDLLGNGTACLVWSSPLPGDGRRQMRYVNLMGDEKPHLLIKTINNLGAITTVTYAPSTRFYLQDKRDGKPWITRLPFPVHCVEKVTVTDKWRKTSFTTTYSYHHGYFDGVEREFRGFGRVEQVDVESFGEFAQGNIASPFITAQRELYQPPVKTITWYHTGASVDRSKILSAFKQEYFPNWVPALSPGGGFQENDLPEPRLGADELTAEEWQEALRACKGMALRQEIYELDVDALERGEHKRVKLFSTAYHNCHIRRLQPRQKNPHAVFLVTESEAITYNYELDLLPAELKPDPRIAHTLNLRIDEFGNVLQSAAVAYRRIERYEDITLSPAEHELIDRVQQEQHIAYTEAHYTNDNKSGVIDDEDDYRLPAPCEVLTYELTGILPEDADDKKTPDLRDNLYFTLEELQRYRLSDRYQTSGESVAEIPYHQLPAQTKPAPPEKRLVEHLRTLFFRENLSGTDPLPFQEQGRLGLPYETYKLALTDDLLNAVFQGRNANGAVIDDKLALEIEPGVTGRGLLRNAGRSGYTPGSAIEPGLAGQYWIRSGIAGFENDAADHFYLPECYTDPFGNVTTLKYDPADLFIQSSTDMLGNTTSVASFDYRVLAASKLKDINDNETEAYFDILGMVVAVAMKGKDNEADNLNGFDDDLANPPLTERVEFFFEDTAYRESESRRWLGNATARHVYYFGETLDANGNIVWGTHPARACGILREKHVAQPKPTVGAQPVDESALQVAFECSDGLGAVLLKKVQAEPAPGEIDLRWIASGKTILNNKGKPVKQYEPYFSMTGHRCEEPIEQGVTPIIYYDAAGRLVRTELPDGTFSRVEFSPWHVLLFDPNDTVRDSTWFTQRNPPDPDVPLPIDGFTGVPAVSPDARAAWLAAQHAGTPALTILDSLGREVISIAHNRFADAAGAVRDEKHLTYTALDAEGKPLWIRDARGNLVMQYITPPAPNNQATDPAASFVPCYDIAGNLLFQHSMDAGDRWMIMDSAGKPMVAWDRNQWQDKNGVDQDVENRIYFTEYDALHRPTHEWLIINDQPAKLVDYTEYGDGLADAKERNLRGQAHLHYDPSGLGQVERLDFKGKPLEVKRTLTNRYNTAVLDWNVTDRTSLLEAETYSQITEYDALGRMTTLYNWHRGPGSRVAVYVPTYSQRGLLSSETLDVRAIKDLTGHTGSGKPPARAIEEIRYGVKGQKEYLELGNGSITEYTYDIQTFRLTNIRTTRPVPPGDRCSSAFNDPAVIQDLRYTYDPAGNITQIYDAAQASAFGGNQRVEPVNRYEYDALYRLVSATGRENGAALGAPPQIEDSPLSRDCPAPDPTALRNYLERYRYDNVGNIMQIGHVASAGSWRRDYAYAFDDRTQPASNRLWQTWTGGDRTQATTYGYDTHGNMLNLANVAEAQYMRWDYRDMIHTLYLIGGGTAYYIYDASKQRTRKRLEHNGGTVEDRIYLGGVEVYRKYLNGTLVVEVESLHLFEGEQRVLLVDDVLRTDNARLPPGPLYRYQYGNYLGSVSLEADDQAKIISYEEYHPYGTSAYRARNGAIEAPPRRYRYTGMERDEESGLDYHRARSYAAWLGRWTGCDPAGVADGNNAYAYVNDRPVVFLDSTGEWHEPGHFNKVYFVSLAAGYGDSTAFKHAYYAQLPDEINELAAAEAGIDVLFDPVPDDIEQDVATQKGGHALTGGDARVEREFRKGITMSYSPFSRPFSLSLHPLTDVVPHRTADQKKMESFPSGHSLRTLFGTDPDLAFLNRDAFRESAVLLYDVLTAAARAEGIKPRLTREQVERFADIISSIKAESQQAITTQRLASEWMNIRMRNVDMQSHATSEPGEFFRLYPVPDGDPDLGIGKNDVVRHGSSVPFHEEPTKELTKEEKVVQESRRLFREWTLRRMGEPDLNK